MAESTNTAAPGRFWLVLRDGFTYTECRHTSEELAMQEAKRLASDVQGSRFYVLECVGFAERPDQVVAVRFKRNETCDVKMDPIDARMMASRVEALLDTIKRKERAAADAKWGIFDLESRKVIHLYRTEDGARKRLLSSPGILFEIRDPAQR